MTRFLPAFAVFFLIRHATALAPTAASNATLQSKKTDGLRAQAPPPGWHGPRAPPTIIAAAAQQPPSISAVAPATSAVYVPMQLGRTVSGYLPFPQTATYSLNITAATPPPITLVLTSLGLGNTDLFGSLGAGSNPSRSSSDYGSVSLPWYATESFTVSSSDAAWTAAGCASSSFCILNVIVYAVRPGNFTLVAATPSTQQVMSPGIPVVRQIAPSGTFDILLFEIPVVGSAGSPATPPTFSIDLAVDGLDNPIAVVFGSSNVAGPPDPNNSSSWCRPPWVFSTLNVNTFHSYVADTGNNCYCGPGNNRGYVGNCSWFVGVLSAYQGVGATVEVISNYDGAAITQLLDGVPQTVALTSQK